MAFYTGTSSSLLISALTMGKLLLLKYPLKLRNLSKKHVHKLCAGIWTVSVFFPALQLAIDKDDVTFDYRNYAGSYRYTSPLWKVLLPVTALMFLVTPGITIVVCTVMILREARKVVKRTQESLRWQGITTVVLTATVYVFAFLPYAIYFFAEPFVHKDPDHPGKFYLEFYRVANGIFQFSILSNFFIYSLTVASFREFLVTKFFKFVSLRWRSSSYRGNALLKCS